MALIESKRTYFRQLEASDADGEYYNWMNNRDIVQFTEARYKPVSRESLKQYILDRNRDSDSLFFAIIDKAANKHIGNIKIGPINMVHRCGDIGIIIGEKDFWGKGYATEAISSLVDFCFKTYGLHKITAGCYENNAGSIRAFQKSGFNIEYRIQKQFLFEGEFIDGVKLCIFNKNEPNTTR